MTIMNQRVNKLLMVLPFIHWIGEVLEVGESRGLIDSGLQSCLVNDLSSTKPQNPKIPEKLCTRGTESAMENSLNSMILVSILH